MTIELLALVGVCAVLMALLAVQGLWTPFTYGFGYGLGARDEPKPRSVFAARVDRAVANHIEGLVMFAPLVVVAAIAGVSTPLTAWGAILYFAARIAFAAFYIAGVPVLRSVAWGVGAGGLLAIFWELGSAALTR